MFVSKEACKFDWASPGLSEGMSQEAFRKNLYPNHAVQINGTKYWAYIGKMCKKINPNSEIHMLVWNVAMIVFLYSSCKYVFSCISLQATALNLTRLFCQSILVFITLTSICSSPLRLLRKWTKQTCSHMHLLMVMGSVSFKWNNILFCFVLCISHLLQTEQFCPSETRCILLEWDETIVFALM